MTVTNLHPEDLLEKDARGLLNEADRARLQAHLALCATCRFERLLRADFAEELRDEDVPEAAVGLTTLQPRVAAPARYEGRAWRPRARTAWLLAAATLLVGSGVAAATGVTRRIWSPPPPAVEPSSEVVPAATESKKAKAVRVAAHAEPPAVVAPVTEAETAAVRASLPAVTAAPMLPPPPEPAPVRLAAPRAPDSSIELLDAEGEARRQGDYERVVSLHRQLISRFPGSREAQVSRATVGRLLLDRGNPADALTSFDAYLSSGSGSLEQEAMVGRATALERLGRRDEAARAWGDLLAAFPESPYAAHAKTRLGGLSGNFSGN